jgi:predicted secreted hydrolase
MSIRRRYRWDIALVTLMAGATVTVIASSGGWKHAEPGRAIVLPGDHRSHPEYRLEWWYYTGNLSSDRGRRFGYQLTFFRIGVVPAAAVPSRWAVRDVYMTHLAVTDVAAGRHVAVERLNRAGINWAGASEDRYRVWNEDWQANLDDNRHRLTAASRTPEISLDLTLDDSMRPVLHGLAGFSRKGSSAGNASYYYSLTRMPTVGWLAIDGRRFDVKGLSWMDHEFGTTFLEANQAGWDWFSLQLDDGRDLMAFRLRGADRTVDPRSSGTLVEADGRVRHLDADSFRVEPGRVWQSPATGGVYPVEWRIVVPGERLDLAVRAAIDAQELHGLRSGLAYWEGAIDVKGTAEGRTLGGRGFLEMTGYSGRPIGELMGGRAR